MAIILSLNDCEEDGKAIGNNIDKGTITGSLISSEIVIQNFSKTYPASLFAFCALQIIEALIAPIEEPARISNFIPCLYKFL